MGNISQMAATVTRLSSDQQTVHFICTTKPKPVSDRIWNRIGKSITPLVSYMFLSAGEQYL